MKVLFIGDIVGRSGRQALAEYLPRLAEKFSWDFCIANGENAAGGKGLTLNVAEELLALGIDCLTMGNHTWDNKEIFQFIDDAQYIVRPANYPIPTPGKGYTIIPSKQGRLGVVSLSGQTFMGPYNCPFAAAEEVLPLLSDCDGIIVDVHAEATSEKVALGRYLDGRVSAVLGTHTHIQTADEKILPRGTLYITDVGMCGAADSILGMEVKPVLTKFTTKLPGRFSAARGPGMVNAVYLDLAEKTIQRINQLPAP